MILGRKKWEKIGYLIQIKIHIALNNRLLLQDLQPLVGHSLILARKGFARRVDDLSK
jgi:hypothetical protein